METYIITFCRFTVYPRPRTGRNLPAFKVKSILKGTEVDCTVEKWSIRCLVDAFSVVSRQELVGWLQQQIAEQKRIDGATAGAPSVLAEAAPDVLLSVKDTALSDVQLLLPDSKKRPKQLKHIFGDKGISFLPVIGECRCNVQISFCQSPVCQECLSRPCTRPSYRCLASPL